MIFERTVLLIIFVFLPLANLQPNPDWSCIYNSDNYITNGTYHSNLIALLATLPTNIQANGFYNASLGQIPDRVNAFAHCRPDIPLDSCRDCVLGSTTDLVNLCPNMRQAFRWNLFCMLRYSNMPIMGIMSTMPSLEHHSSFNVSTSPVAFMVELMILLNNLRRSAAYHGNLYTVGGSARTSTSANETPILYALAQCTPDLSRNDCNSCLADAIDRVPWCCDWSIGARILRPSCILRYEISSFFDATRFRHLAPLDVPQQPSPSPNLPQLAPLGVQTPPSSLSSPPPLTRGYVIIIIIVVSVIASITLATFAAYLVRRRRKQKLIEEFERKNKGIELFLKNEGFAPKRYKYSDLKMITNSFSDILGKGGFGSVYKGKLQDGRLTAVKLLNESKGNGEDFMNEVASISRTSHVNIVILLGFCLEGSKRALIYEFMPNGSLDKYLRDISSLTDEEHLGWEKLFEITFGVARGLEYLHQGCNTRILHLDIKPHNILLDKDFKPKISDFGLAKLCPDRASIISMLGTRGTVGYIAPEVFCRNFGDISHKSDVYSFGMLVLEMVGGRKNVNNRVERSSDAYFPDWIYKQLEEDADEGVDDIFDEYEGKFAKRKLTIIGLWCIQTDPKNRPSISRVVEMLEGNLESLQVPPKPYLFSPAKLQAADEASCSTLGSSY